MRYIYSKNSLNDPRGTSVVLKSLQERCVLKDLDGLYQWTAKNNLKWIKQGISEKDSFALLGNIDKLLRKTDKNFRRTLGAEILIILSNGYDCYLEHRGDTIEKNSIIKNQILCYFHPVAVVSDSSMGSSAASASPSSSSTKVQKSVSSGVLHDRLGSYADKDVEIDFCRFFPSVEQDKRSEGSSSRSDAREWRPKSSEGGAQSTGSGKPGHVAAPSQNSSSSSPPIQARFGQPSVNFPARLDNSTSASSSAVSSPLKSHPVSPPLAPPKEATGGALPASSTSSSNSASAASSKRQKESGGGAQSTGGSKSGPASSSSKSSPLSNSRSRRPGDRYSQSFATQSLISNVPAATLTSSVESSSLLRHSGAANVVENEISTAASRSLQAQTAIQSLNVIGHTGIPGSDAAESGITLATFSSFWTNNSRSQRYIDFLKTLKERKSETI